MTCAVPGEATSAAEIVAKTCVAVANAVVRALPFHCTTELATNPVPFTPRVNAADPAATLEADRPVMAGTGFWIATPAALEVPPPGDGLTTTTCAVLTEAVSAAVIAAVSRTALTNVVGRALPFHCTTELATNPVPFTVRVKAADPGITVAGDTLVIAGTGFWIVTLAALEVPPPGEGFTTVTCPEPVAATSAVVIAAVSCAALTNVVGRALPFHCTTEPATNPVPFTVRVNAPDPATTLEGETLLTAGTAFWLDGNTFDCAEPPPQPVDASARSKSAVNAVNRARAITASCEKTVQASRGAL